MQLVSHTSVITNNKDCSWSLKLHNLTTWISFNQSKSKTEVKPLNRVGWWEGGRKQTKDKQPTLRGRTGGRCDNIKSQPLGRELMKSWIYFYLEIFTTSNWNIKLSASLDQILTWRADKGLVWYLTYLILLLSQNLASVDFRQSTRKVKNKDRKAEQWKSCWFHARMNLKTWFQMRALQASRETWESWHSLPILVFFQKRLSGFKTGSNYEYVITFAKESLIQFTTRRNDSFFQRWANPFDFHHLFISVVI